MGILEKIAEIEKEISRTQKNKGKVCYAPEFRAPLFREKAMLPKVKHNIT